MQLDVKRLASHCKSCSCTKNKHEVIQHNVKEATSQEFQIWNFRIKILARNLSSPYIATLSVASHAFVESKYDSELYLDGIAMLVLYRYKLIRAVKQSASLNNYVNQKDTELYTACSAVWVPYISPVLRIITF